MTKSKIFFVLSLSFLGGVFAASFFLIENYSVLILFASALALFVINHQNKVIIVVSAAVLFLALGIWRTNVSLDTAKNNLANQKLGPADFSAMVIQEPEISETYQKIVVRNGNGDKILINSDIYPSYNYGDELKVKCILQEPKNYENSRFDYKMYLAKDGIHRICNKANVLILGSNRGNAFYNFILNIKNKFEEKLSQIFPDPEGAYLKGLLLGGSRRMTKDLSEAFQRTGTTHTVAVSGYNVTIVAAFLMWLGIYPGFWRQQVFSFAVVGIVLFVLMTGAPSSAVRAGIMGALVIWAMKEGRLANSTNAILLAAGAMLAINPLLLRYDAGFQLSFLATLGIVYLSPLLEKIFWQGRAPKIIQETVILSISAIIFVLPIILNSFEKLSLVSPFANFVILPAIPAIMGTGFAAGIAGFIFVPLGKLVGFVPYLLLKIEIFVVQWMANLSWASVEVKNFGWEYIIVYYLFLFLALHYFKRRDKKLSMQVDEK
ncbi:MAG: ComEC/Rec2 family competence protein [Patescibacteria group bacterium]|nr:ComEC/Rec2 family competence protein [Patescibacteria group bacterium]